MGCAGGCGKLMLTFIGINSFILMGFGCAAIAIGSIMKSYEDSNNNFWNWNSYYYGPSYYYFQDYNYFYNKNDFIVLGTLVGTVSVAFMAVGVAMMILALFGMIALCTTCKCCGGTMVPVAVYTFLQLCLTVAAAVLVGFLVNQPQTVTDYFRGDVKLRLQENFSGLNGTDRISSHWNAIMREFDCCGVDNFNDFDSAVSWQMSKGSLLTPLACCKEWPTSPVTDFELPCAKSLDPATNNFMTGCWDELWKFLYTTWTTVAEATAVAVPASTALFGILAIILNSLDKSGNRVSSA